MMNWNTLHNRDSLKCNVPANQKHHDYITSPIHGLNGEYSLQEEKNGKFDHWQCCVPEELHHEQVLYLRQCG